MRLRRFQVTNYRSITKAPFISLENNLTIIGPNNEGKSNLVRALVTSLRTLEEHGQGSILRTALRLRTRQRTYDWGADCPIQLQNNPETKTVFSLYFHLSAVDRDEFMSAIGSLINDNLPIQITIGSDNKPEFNVNKQGPGKAVLSSKSRQIAAFVGSRLSINHIAAVRTAREAESAMEGLVASALRQVERLQEYLDALATIERLQQPVLAELETQLSGTLQQFLPSVNKVSLTVSESRQQALRSTQINIDDGQSTPLSHKGDGVISLVSMALLARLTSSSGTDLNTILAIEEPESHLHPRAIHSIRSIIDNIGHDYQVIITTHSPALVDRVRLSANVLVENNQAKVVSDIAQVRQALGVRVSDNLTNSRIAIVCEGKDDGEKLSKLICELEPSLEHSLQTAEVSFIPLNGSGNLSYVATNLQNSICEPICFLDNDEAGRAAYEMAKKDGVITDEDIIFALVLGKDETEFEDLIDPDIIQSAIKLRYKADMDSIPTGMRKKKFSVRLRGALELAGRPYDDKVKAQAKSIIGEQVRIHGISAISEMNRGPIITLATLTMERLKNER